MTSNGECERCGMENCLSRYGDKHLCWRCAYALRETAAIDAIVAPVGPVPLSSVELDDEDSAETILDYALDLVGYPQ